MSFVHTEEPSIVYMTDDQILSVNSTSEEVLQFVCNATGTPHLELTWAHNGMTIEENDNRHLVKNEVSTNSMLTVIYSVLTISDPTLTDTGTISCKASISFQKDNSTTTNTGAVRTISEKLERELIVLGMHKCNHTVSMCMTIKLSLMTTQHIYLI